MTDALASPAAYRDSVSERDLQAAIVAAARHRRWLVGSHWNSKHSPEGFPDLVMLRGSRLVVAELKSSTGRLTAAQRVWLEAFVAADCEAYVVAPSELTWFVEDVLA